MSNRNRAHCNRAATSMKRRLLWLAAAPTLAVGIITLDHDNLLWAQAPNPLEGVDIPTTLEAGSKLAIESSETMRNVNEALQSRFADQFGDVQVDVAYSNSDQAVQALTDGTVNLAAIGRSLTEAEVQAGLTEVPLTRHKIAIVIGPENPFNGSLTIEQFAQIFRGDITNWAEVGGPDAPIVLVDRPATSDTRQAFRNYPVFQTAPFEAAPGATRLQEDSTEAVAKDLGSTGISYTIAEQAIDNPAVKIVPMHDTLPDDPRYPFSQPLAYVYRAAEPTPAALAFLGYATNPENAAVIEAARAAAADTAAAGATADTGTAAAPTTTETPAATEAPAATETPAATQDPTVTEAEEPAAVATPNRGVPWWPWLLALPVLGGLLWWLLRGAAPVAAPLAAPLVSEPDRRIILTPRNCRDAYAYWELPEAEVAALRRQNYSLALKLHDVTDIANVDQQPPHSTRQFPCDTVAVGDQHLPVPVDNRDYLVELGYVDSDNAWHALARSAHVRVPACPSVVGHQAVGVGAAAAGAVAGAALAQPPVASEPARVILTPRDCRQAYAYWEIPVQEVDRLRADRRSLKVRLYDVTELPGGPANGHNSLQEFDAELTAQGDLHLPIAVDDRDYLVEIGYVDGLGHWQTLAKADSVRVPACADPVSLVPSAAAAAKFTPAPTNGSGQGAGTLDGLRSKASELTSTVGQATTNLVEGAGTVTGAAVASSAAAVAGLGAAARSVLDRSTGSVDVEAAPTSGIGTRSDLGAESKIILVPRGTNTAYAYWEAADVHKQALKNQGGRALALRIHDATNLELDYQAPHSTQEYILQDGDQDKHVLIPVPDRDYVAELGYLTDSGEWLQLIRSLHVRVPQG